MNESEEMTRHLLDLCRRADQGGFRCYSSFLTPAEQDDFIRHPSAASFCWNFEGGYENAERKILAAGTDDETDPAEVPIKIIRAEPQNDKFAEDLTHRDYLGAVMNLGIDRSTVGDIIVRDRKAWIICLSHVADILLTDLTRVRRTTIRTSEGSPEDEELKPRFEPVFVNAASERLDAMAAEFSGVSRSQISPLFSAGKIFVNGRAVTDRSAKLHPGDVLSIRGFGKGRYEGIDRETRKGRLVALFQKYV